jgi:FdrA protein
MPPLAVFNLVRRGTYHDSVTLLRLGGALERVPGVTRAAAMMGTPANRALLADAGLLAESGEHAGPTDLVIAVVAETASVAELAWQEAAHALTRTHAGGAASRGRPRSLDAALRAMPDATLALVSVPGLYAAAEATRALLAGLDVMLFSDNVPLGDEVRLKRLARERGRFMMGPDCGTAILGGVPLGFANAVPRGRIGLAAASGTGLQAVSCHIAAAGEGVSHAIGLGGRDLSDDVGGLMLEPALAALAADPETTVICVIGKPPGLVTGEKLRGWIAALGKPCVTHFTGDAGHSTTATLEDAAAAAVAVARGESPRPAPLAADAARVAASAATVVRPGGRFVRGVFAGGTLAQEAAALLGTRVGGGDGHRVVDLGDDAYTVARPHPMIDGTLRQQWIGREARDPATAVILFDVVLGYGAHPDPAGELLPAIATARAQQVALVASVCGTAGDPQGLARQTTALGAAGVLVMPSNARAARLAGLIATRAADRA